ncbi:hypothetical protein F5Y12DRAFT_798699 [Xylaria sp. FL1777]|nr:hypothetical protein F5Y12DRAFT_798699 [Xylaria sp. FL1777]
MSMSIAFVICLLEGLALGGPVTTPEHLTFLPGNATVHTNPIPPSTFLNTTAKDAAQDAGNSSPAPQDNSNAIIGIILGPLVAIGLIVWVMMRFVLRREAKGR